MRERQSNLDGYRLNIRRKGAGIAFAATLLSSLIAAVAAPLSEPNSDPRPFPTPSWSLGRIPSPEKLEMPTTRPFTFESPQPAPKPK